MIGTITITGEFRSYGSNLYKKVYGTLSLKNYSNYKNLTNDNFLIKIKSIAYTPFQPRQGDNRSGGFYWSGIDYTYDAITGLLTVSNCGYVLANSSSWDVDHDSYQPQVYQSGVTYEIYIMP